MDHQDNEDPGTNHEEDIMNFNIENNMKADDYINFRALKY